MKLVFAKIDRVDEDEHGKVLHIPAGGIQFEGKSALILLQEPVQIEMAHSGMFKNVIRDVEFVVYSDLSLNPQENVQKWSLFSVVSHEEFYSAIYERLRHCKIAPIKRYVNERELFASEYANMYKELLGV